MMRTTSMNIHRAVRSLAVATVLVGLWLSAATPVRAAGPYPWSDQPEYQPDYQQSQAEQFNDRARQNAQAYEQMEQYRQESLRQERERNSTPARPPSYQKQYWVQGRDGRSTLCVPQYNKSIVSCY